MRKDLAELFPSVSGLILDAVCQQAASLDEAVEKVLLLTGNGYDYEEEEAQKETRQLCGGKGVAAAPVPGCGVRAGDDDDDGLPPLEDLPPPCSSSSSSFVPQGPAAAAAARSSDNDEAPPTSSSSSDVEKIVQIQAMFPQVTRAEAMKYISAHGGDLHAAIDTLLMSLSDMTDGGQAAPSVTNQLQKKSVKPAQRHAPAAPQAVAYDDDDLPPLESVLAASSSSRDPPVGSAPLPPPLAPPPPAPRPDAPSTNTRSGPDDGCGSIEMWQDLFPGVDPRLVREAIDRHRNDGKAAAQNAIFNNLSKHTKRSGGHYRDPSSPASLGNSPPPPPYVSPKDPSNNEARGFKIADGNRARTNDRPPIPAPLSVGVGYPRRQSPKSIQLFQPILSPSFALGGQNTTVHAPPAAASSPSAAALHFHVYLDYDNLQMSTAAPPLHVVQEVQRHLEHSRCGRGRKAIFHVEAFIVPLSQITKQQERDLRDIGVKIIQCSDKKGDADLQLLKSVREMLSLGLSPDAHELVILSSDRDFTTAAEDVRRAGYKIGCFHFAFRGSPHEQVLEHMYDYCVSLRQLMPRALEQRRR